MAIIIIFDAVKVIITTTIIMVTVTSTTNNRKGMIVIVIPLNCFQLMMTLHADQAVSDGLQDWVQCSKHLCGLYVRSQKTHSAS